MTFLTTQLNVDSFKEAFASASANFLKAGVIYAEDIKAHGVAAREAYAAAFPVIRQSTWRKLENLGRGALDERLLMNGTPGAHALARLPIHAQREALDNSVDTLIGNGESLLIKVDDLTAEQVRQVFALDHIRSLPEQRAYLEAKSPVMTVDPKVRQKHWRVVNGKVRITHPCELTRIDMANMLAEMG